MSCDTKTIAAHVIPFILSHLTYLPVNLHSSLCHLSLHCHSVFLPTVHRQSSCRPLLLLVVCLLALLLGWRCLFCQSKPRQRQHQLSLCCGEKLGEWGAAVTFQRVKSPLRFVQLCLGEISRGLGCHGAQFPYAEVGMATCWREKWFVARRENVVLRPAGSSFTRSLWRSVFHIYYLCNIKIILKKRLKEHLHIVRMVIIQYVLKYYLSFFVVLFDYDCMDAAALEQYSLITSLIT